MKKLIIISAIVAVSTKAFAIIPVLVDFDLTWPLQAAQWTQQIAQATATVQQAKQIVSGTKTLINYAGDPKSAVRSMSDVSSIVSSIGRMTNSSQTADAVTKNFDATNALMSSVNNFRTEVGSTMDVFGRSAPRNTSYYGASLALENVMNNTKRMLESNRVNQEQLGKQLQMANDRLRIATTQSDIASAQAEIGRLSAMMQASDVASRNIIDGARIEKELREIASEDRATRRLEEINAKATQMALQQENTRKAFNSNVGRNLADGTEVKWDTAKMFPTVIP